jgi:hypothetical protein
MLHGLGILYKSQIKLKLSGMGNVGIVPMSQDYYQGKRGLNLYLQVD